MLFQRCLGWFELFFVTEVVTDRKKTTVTSRQESFYGDFYYYLQKVLRQFWLQSWCAH